MSEIIVFIIALVITVLLWFIISAGYLPLTLIAFLIGGTAALMYMINELKRK